MTDEEIEQILLECTFISKADEWYTEGTEVEFLSLVYFPSGIKKFKDGSGLMKGMTNEYFKGYIGELPRLDEEGCPLDEFEIYDKHGTYISDMTFDEYKIHLRDSKLKKLLD